MIVKPRRPVLCRAHPLARELWAAWLAHEGTGSTLHDASGFARHGTFHGVTWSGRDLYFSSDWIELGISYPAGNAVTVFAEVKSPANWYFVGNHPTSGGTLWFLGRNTSNQATFRYNNGGEQILNGTSNIGNGQWHKVIGTCDKDSARLFVDGSLEASNSIGGDWGVKTIYIGREDAGTYYTGYIRSIMIWNRPLSDAEIAAVFANPYAIFTPRLRAIPATQATGLTSVILSWQDNSEHEDGFVIERATDGGSFAEIDTVGADVESYTDSVETGHTYAYRVRATSTTLGDSEYSNEAEISV